MTRTLVRGAVTAALTVALAAGLGAGTASAATAAPAATAAVTAAPALPAYCNALNRLHNRFPKLAERLPRQIIDRCAPTPSGGLSDNQIVILPGTGSSPGSGFEGGIVNS